MSSSNNNREGGYEYQWRMWQDNSIVSEETRTILRSQICYLWEYRINYMLKKRPTYGFNLDTYDKVMESKSLQFQWRCLDSGEDEDEDEDEPFRQTFIVLQLWGLPADEAQSLVSQVRSFSHQMMVDAENEGRNILPMVVAIDISTVQREGEAIDTLKRRAIKRTDLQSLFDLALNSMEEIEPPSRSSFEVHDVFKVSLEREDGDGMFDECAICLQKPRVGDEVCFLPCDHGYHSDCILTWLEKSGSCPMCRSPCTIE